MNTTSSARSSLNASIGRTRSRLGLFVFVLVLCIIACVPLFGMLFTPSADLSLHVLTSKLLWEKLAGVSHFDIEISWYFGYRLSAYLIVLTIALCRLFGISLLYLPQIVLISTASIHAAIIGAVCYPSIPKERLRTWLPALGFALPAVISVYSAAWLIGFLGYVLAISFLIAAIVLTDRFLRSGRTVDAVLTALAVVMVYVSHPFAIAFWMLWCGSRVLISIASLTIRTEWKRLIMLALIAAALSIYHFFATANTAMLAPAGAVGSPFVSAGEWYQNRFLPFLSGAYLQADDMADPKPFALLAIILTVAAAILVFWRSRASELRMLLVSSLVFVLIGSWVNEQFIPIPKGHWLAYDLRFGSTAYAVCLAVAAIVLIRLLPVAGDRRAYMRFVNALAFLSAAISAYQLYEVRDADRRYDTPARAYVNNMFEHGRPLPGSFPRSPWYQDARLSLRRYRCLKEADCNPAGTLFWTIGGDVYPVRVKSGRRELPPRPYPTDLYGPPGNAFSGGSGFAGGEFIIPRGLAVDNVGNIYVADTGNIRVQKFDAEGRFLWDFGTYGTAQGEFSEPTGIAVDDAGMIYVTDPPGRKLMRFRPDGSFEREWKGDAGDFKRPIEIAIAPDKLLYITDLDEHAIVKFDPARGTIGRFGYAGKGNGGFDWLSGIGIGSGMVFVADVGTDLIQVFDLDGHFVRQWKVDAWNRWHFHYPDVAVDEQSGRVYVTNGGWSSDIWVYTLDGTLINQTNTDGYSDLMNPSSIVISTVGGRKGLFILNTGGEVKDIGDPRVSVIPLGN